MHQAISINHGVPVTSPYGYRLCRYLPEWHPVVHEHTPQTVFTARNADFEAALAKHAWPAYFVKDYVKSLTTKRGSIAASASDVKEIVGLIEEFRGIVEGGVCTQPYEDLMPETEERYFVLNGRAYSSDRVVPELVHEIARRSISPFFSADLAMRSDGTLRLIELGDGQVSSLKSGLPRLLFR